VGGVSLLSSVLSALALAFFFSWTQALFS